METKRPWYEKKRYLIPLAILGAWGLVSAFSTPTPTQVPIQSYQSQYTQTQVQTATPSSYYNPNSDNLSNNNYYINTQGNTVHSPAYAPSIPAGASAQCRDGTYSFSQSRSGTCSHHGGVSSWL